MTSPIETNNVVERLGHDLALISLEYAAKGLEREAGRVMQALNLIERQEAERQSLSDRIDELEGEKAARERGHRGTGAFNTA